MSCHKRCKRLNYALTMNAVRGSSKSASLQENKFVLPGKYKKLQFQSFRALILVVFFSRILFRNFFPVEMNVKKPCEEILKSTLYIHRINTCVAQKESMVHARSCSV